MPNTQLSAENVEFCNGVAAFCERHKISVRNLSAMAGGSRIKFSSATAHRVLHATADDKTIDRVRSAIAAAFATFLEDCGYFATESQSELSEIFNPEEIMKNITQRCDLPYAVRQFFGLQFDPFDIDLMPQPVEVFLTPELEAVIQQGVEAVMYHKFVAFVGDVGTGKTLLKNMIAHRLQQMHEGSRLLYPEFFSMDEVTVGGIAAQILVEFGVTVPREKPKRVLAIKGILSSLHQEGLGCALMMDEAHRLSDKVLSSLKNFWELNNGAFSRLLGVILFGQPHFKDNLQKPLFREIRQRLQIIEMPDMSDAAPKYIAHRLQLADGDIDALFDPAAIRKITAKVSSPLAIGNLVNGALMAAFNAEEKMVTADLPYFRDLYTTKADGATMRRAA